MKPQPNKTALCIGINAYGHGSDLAGCVNDATDWRDALDEREFAAEVLLEADATAANVLEEIRQFVDTLKRGDVGVITYSGHGTYVNDVDGDEVDGRDEAICPVDVFDGHVITDDQLRELFNDRERGSRLVFISDSCHSGTVSRFAVHQTDAQHPARVRFLPPGDFLPKNLRPLGGRGMARSSAGLTSSALLMAGCRDAEYSYDAWFDQRPNGAFTRAALDALAELPAGSTYRHWQTAIRNALPSREYPQSPQLLGTSSQTKWRALQ